jgi:hypothetical protein
MMEEQALKTVIDLLGARAVIEHITGQTPSEQVRVACVLAIGGSGQLTEQDTATIAAITSEP